MIVAVALVLMMQMAVHQIVDVVAMRYWFMSTSGSVNMPRFVTAANMTCGTTVRVGGRNFNDVLLNLCRSSLMVQMAVVQIVHMIAMQNAGVPTIYAMNMIVIIVRGIHYSALEFLDHFVLGLLTVSQPIGNQFSDMVIG